MNRWEFKWLLSLIILAAGLWTLPLVAVVLALILDLAVALWTAQHWQKQQIRWREQIKLEDNRMLGIYRFFNMFTEVPMLAGTIKRRRYLDWLFKTIKPQHDHLYLYLFSRGWSGAANSVAWSFG